MRIVVSGGGTGGHIYPALAVAESLKRLRPDTEILYIGATTGMETGIVPNHGVEFRAVTAKKLRKTVSLSTFSVMFSLLRGYGEARKVLREFRADAVVGTGGYVAAATVLAAARLGIPTVIHEGNAIAGRTNLWLARFVRRICVTFEASVSQFPEAKTVVTGFPTRGGIVAPESVSQAAARQTFAGLSAERFTILVTGGSQGARAINRVVIEAAQDLQTAGLQIIHHVGAKNFEDANRQAQERGLLETGHYLPVAYLDGAAMPLAWRACDVVVCRGGISTLTEALVNFRPAIIIPLPTSYADHQTCNARELETAGAALLTPEPALTAPKLTADLLNLRDNPLTYQNMTNVCRALARPDAADRVAKIALSVR